MRGLTIVVVSAEATRFDAALTLATANAALGGRTRLYLHGAAVTRPLSGELYHTAHELGVTFIACQTALDVQSVALPADAAGGGMVGLLASLEDDRLVVV